MFLFNHCFFRKSSFLLQHNLKRICQQHHTSSGSHNNLNHVEYLEKEPFYKLSQLRKHSTRRTNNKCNSWVELWKDRLHFVSLPLYNFGNWIPYSLMHWPCFGSGCALAQVVIKSSEGTTQGPAGGGVGGIANNSQIEAITPSPAHITSEEFDYGAFHSRVRPAVHGNPLRKQSFSRNLENGDVIVTMISPCPSFTEIQIYM